MPPTDPPFQFFADAAGRKISHNSVRDWRKLKGLAGERSFAFLKDGCARQPRLEAQGAKEIHQM
jgi:hypothetical protein